MFLKRPSYLSTFLILLLINLAACYQNALQKIYYVDSSSSEPESGDSVQPFHSFSTAFAKVQEDVSNVEATQELEIVFYCGDTAEFFDFDNSPSLFLDNGSRPPSTIIFKPYSRPGSTSEKIRQPTFVFRSASSHLAFTIRNTKLNFEGIAFSFNVQAGLSTPEIIEVKGEYTEVIFSSCRFFDSITNLQNPNSAIFNLKNGRYMIKNCEFENLDLTNPLFQVEDSRNGMVKFELNKFSDVRTTENPFTKIRGVTVFDFVENTVEKASGRLFDVTSCRNIIIHQNTFNNIHGEMPFKINSVQNVIIEKSKLRFHFADGEHRGFLSLSNFNTFHLKDTTVEGYSGTLPVFTVLMEESYQPQANSMINVKNVAFTKNSVLYRELEDQAGLSLFRVGIKKQNTRIIIADSVFSENRIVDERENPIQRNLGASTIWIEGQESSFDLKNTTIKANKANRALTNLYAFAEAVKVMDCQFSNNGQIDTADPNKNNAGLFTSLTWYGDDLHFMGSVFEENYADNGGAISLLEEDSPIAPHTVLIEGCKFIRNKAKVGGAIYNNINSDRLAGIQLKANQFDNNEADQYPMYNENAKFSTGTKLNMYLEETFKGKTKRYISGELLLENIISGQHVDHTFELFLSDSKVRRAPIGGHYISSISIIGEEGVMLLENFTGKATGASFKLDKLTVIAPAGTVNVIRATMKNRDKSEEVYKFEWKVSINKEVITCNLGEFYSQEANRCMKCPAGQFSIERNTNKCLPCPIGADCSEGGHRIKLLEGYWRDISVMYDEDVIVYPCVGTHKEHCLGGFDSQCKDGYVGPLCGSCDTMNPNEKLKYRPFLRDTCKVCNPVSAFEIAEDIVAFAVPGVTLLYTVYLLLSVKKGLSQGGQENSNKLQTCLYVNLFIGYMQNMFVLDTLGYISLPSHALYVINLFANPTFPTFGFLTCHLRSILPFFQITDASARYLTIFGSLLGAKVVGLILVVALFNKNRSFLKSVSLSLIWLMMMETPGILDFVLRYFDCHQIGHSTYSSFSMNVECDTKLSLMLKTYTLIPAVLFFAGLFPLAVTYSLIRGALRSDENELHKRMKILALARSAEHIDKSNRNWMSFFWVAFGRFGLLAIAASERQELWNIGAAVFYYATVILFNKSRKISLFSNWRANLLLLDAAVVLCSLGAGYVGSIVEQDVAKDLFKNLILVVNATYFIVVYVGCLFPSEASSYGKLDEEGASKVAGSSESEDEEQDQGPGHPPSSDNLDDSM